VSGGYEKYPLPHRGFAHLLTICYFQAVHGNSMGPLLEEKSRRAIVQRGWGGCRMGGYPRSRIAFWIASVPENNAMGCSPLGPAPINPVVD